MRLFGSIVVILMLSACNGGGAQPPDAPSTTGEGSTTTGQPQPETTSSVAPTTTTVNPNPGNTIGGTPAPTVHTDEHPPNGAAQPGTCGGRTCGAGESCASYYGIAGPRGPMFHECVIRCRRGQPNDGCPTGTVCHTVADGPGDVCR